jgi:hypothetical protein
MLKLIPIISKKFLIISLLILFLVSMIFFISPGNVSAAPAVVYVATASEFVSAITSASAGDTIKLTANITIIQMMTINKAITIDMNGFNISGNPDLSASYHYAFKVVFGGDLTLDNTSATLSKLLVGTGQADERNYRGIRIDRSGKATVKANVSIETGLPVMVYGNGVAGSAQLDVYGKLMVSVQYDATSAYATISGNGTPGYGGTIINIHSGAEVINPYDAALYIPQEGVVNVSGGTITGLASAIGIKSGTLNISGGTLTATGPANIPTVGFSNGINGSGCTIQIESNNAYSGNIVVNITGGTIISTNGYALYEYLNVGNTVTEVDNISISGGSFQSGATVGSDILISKELDTSNPAKLTVIGGTFSKANAGETPTGTAGAPTPPPLTPAEQASLTLSITQQVDLYGVSNIGFTKMLYDNILGRSAESEGLNDWVTALNNGTITLGSVVYNCVFSEELKPEISSFTDEEFVNFLYKNVLNREQDPDGYNNWVSLMQNGMTKEEVLLHFIDSGEFKNICEMFGLKP